MPQKSLALRFLLALLRLGLGLFFAYTGLLKISQLNITETFIARSRLPLLPESFYMPLACIGVAMELSIAFCLIFKKCYYGAALWCLTMCCVFFALYLQGWARGLELTCNCLGKATEVINYPLDTAVRLLLVAASLLLVWDASNSPEKKLWGGRGGLKIREY